MRKYFVRDGLQVMELRRGCPRKKRVKKRASTARRLLRWALALLGCALLLVAGRYAYVVFFNPMGAFQATVQAANAPAPAPTPRHQAMLTPSSTLPPETPEPTLSPEEALQAEADLDFMENRVNILLLGWDQSPEREEEESALYRDEDNNFRSDVLLLLAVDFQEKKVDLISIPRDTYAPIYNVKGRWKINAAFAHGTTDGGQGPQYAMNTVSDLLGVPIAYYAGVDMAGLKAVVDAMGGVEYDVDVRIVLNGRVLEKGYQHMDGQQVLDYCRARKGISTDVGRADRQQRMLFAIFEQLKSRNQLVNLPKIYSSVQDKVQTNLNVGQIAALSVFAMQLDMEDLRRHTLAGAYMEDYKGTMFYVLYNSKLRALVKDVFGISIKTKAAYDASYVQRKREEAEAAAQAEAEALWGGQGGADAPYGGEPPG